MGLLGMAAGLLRAASGGRSSIPAAFGAARRGLLWSVEREIDHVYKDPDAIINHAAIEAAMERTKAHATDPAAIRAVLQAAKDRSFLTNFTPGAALGPGGAASSARQMAPPQAPQPHPTPAPPRPQASRSTCRA
jgi:hypothetical protein